MVAVAGDRSLEDFVAPGGGGTAVALDDAGRFVATGLAKGQVTVSAIVPGRSRVTGKPVAVPYEGEYVFTVDAGTAAVEGKVVADADGKPIEGAEVIGGGSGGDVTLAVEHVTTDATGTFHFVLPAGRDSGLFVRAEGFAPQTVRRRDAKPGPIEVRLAKGGRIEGRVTSEGDAKPVAGVTVRAAPARSGDAPFPPEPVTSGDDGRYALSDLPPGELMVSASGDGWVTKGQGTARREGFNPLVATVKAGETTTFDLVVVRGAVARGKVLGPAGAPVLGAVVRAQGQGGLEFRGPRFFGSGGEVASTAADGSFTIDTLASGTNYSFEATAAGYAKAKAGPFAASDSAPIAVEIRFAAPRWVDVSVLDAASGAPVADAQVAASVEGPENSWTGDGTRWTTSADGKARVGPLAASRVRLSATAPDYVRLDDLQPLGTEETTAVLQLRRGYAVSGKVRNPDGTPAVGVGVSVTNPQGFWGIRDTTAADGSFRLRGLPEGKVTVEAVWVDDRTRRSAGATVTAGQDDVLLTLTSAPGTDGRGAPLVVTVVGPDGKPVPRARIRIRTENGSSSTGVRDGQATFSGDEARSVGTIEVWGASTADGTPLPYGPARVERAKGAGGGEIEVRLPAELAIAGVVLTADGKGVRGALVRALVPPGPDDRTRSVDTEGVASARSGDDGAFRIGGLGGDEYVLEVQPPPGSIGPEGVRARGGQSGVTLRLRAGQTVSITVGDREGKPLAGVSVRAARTRDGDRWIPGETVPTTDAAGVARLPDLDPDATYSLTLTPPRNRTDLLTPPVVKDWRPRDDVFVLERGYVVKGVVRDQTGRPVANASVMRKEGENSWRGGAQTAEDGTFTLAQVPAGQATVAVQVADGMMIRWPDGGLLAQTTVVAGSENVVLTVDLGLALTVVVENPSADRWLQARLTREGAGPGGGTANAMLRDATARFRGLRSDETYTLSIGPTSDGSVVYQTGVRAGGDLRVRLAPGKTVTVRVVAPAGAQNVGVSVEGPGFSAPGRAGPDGRVEIRGVPDGTWKVRVNAQVGSDWWSGEATVSAGSSVDVEVKAPSAPPR